MPTDDPGEYLASIHVQCATDHLAEQVIEIVGDALHRFRDRDVWQIWTAGIRGPDSSPDPERVELENRVSALVAAIQQHKAEYIAFAQTVLDQNGSDRTPEDVAPAANRALWAAAADQEATTDD